MNQARSMYKTDYVPYDWMQNNFTLRTDSFCTVENIDDCIRYISEEFSALGYPSIYLNSSSCPYSVNCDIVKLLNVTFELIGNSKDQAEIKEDLESRNRQLLSNLNTLHEKNSQLKENLEHIKNKYKASFEIERQMKGKNNSLQQLIKSEKDESKKLSHQIQQQKVTYQHEIRKYENNMNQMKTRLNQILSDKNPDKKIASIKPSSLLQRNSKQRGKWKTGSVAKSSMEEMYGSVISSYENRCQELVREVSCFRQSLEYIHTQMIETVTVLGDPTKDDDTWIMDVIPLRAIWGSPNMQEELEEQFKCLLCRIRENFLEKCEGKSEKSGDKAFSLSSSLPLKDEQKSKETTSGSDADCAAVSCDSQMKLLVDEKEKLNKKELELSATSAVLEREKRIIEMKKLEVIKLALQQEVPESQWHQNLHSIASFSVMTTNSGLTSVPSAKQLKQCLSAPDQEIKSLIPLWKSESSRTDDVHGSRSEATLRTSKLDSPPGESVLNLCPVTAQNDTSDLPKWAIAALSVPPTDSTPCALGDEGNIANCSSNEELELSAVSSSEEVNLALLRAAMEDIESRRTHLSL